MPLDKSYGILKGRAVKRQIETEENSPHFQVQVQAKELDYRIAINVKSVQKPFDLLYFVDENFRHPITDALVKLEFGFTEIKLPDRKAGGTALDYIRGNLFDVNKMKPLPFNVPGLENDLNEIIELFIQRAIASDEAVIYAFGEPWGPEEKPDKIFKFQPGRGIHNIHMNQGSSGKFSQENGVFQDGGLLIHFPLRSQWIAAFFAFQSQSFHTNDVTGNPLTVEPGAEPLPLDPTIPQVSAKVRIVAALVNPRGDDVGKELVTLLNTSPENVNLNGWQLADRLKQKHPLSGSIEPGAFLKVALTGKTVQLSNEGGIITLLDDKGIKIDGVSYTKEDVKNAGWTVLF